MPGNSLLNNQFFKVIIKNPQTNQSMLSVPCANKEIADLVSNNFNKLFPGFIISLEQNQGNSQKPVAKTDAPEKILPELTNIQQALPKNLHLESAFTTKQNLDLFSELSQDLFEDVA